MLNVIFISFLIVLNILFTSAQIERLNGEPQIVNCPSDVDSISGDQVSRNVIVKNIGKEEGTFLFSASCDNPNIRILGNDISSIKSGQTTTSGIFVTVSVTEQQGTTSGTCTIQFNDKNSGNKDSCQFNVKRTFSNVICQAFEEYCSKDFTQILQCNDIGNGLAVIKTCDSNTACGESQTTKQLECIDKGFLYKIKDMPFFPLISVLIIAAAIIIGFIILAIILKRKIKK